MESVGVIHPQKFPQTFSCEEVHLNFDRSVLLLNKTISYPHVGKTRIVVVDEET